MEQTELASDAPRCHGFCCQQREHCLRYTERSNYQASTTFASHLCDVEAEGMTYYIPAKESK